MVVASLMRLGGWGSNEIMKDIGIVTDSIADIPDGLLDQYGIHMVPAYVRFGNEVYRDRSEIKPYEVLNRMVQTGQPPKTSQPSPGDFLEVYKALAEKAKTILSIHPSSILTGTFQSARIASGILSELDIRLIDTMNGSLGQGWAVIEAARAAVRGVDADRIVQLAKGVAGRMHTVISVDTLEFIYKGGRIGRAQAIIGNMLHVKPILYLDKGALVPLDKVIGRGAVIPRLLDYISSTVGEGSPINVGIGYAGLKENAVRLREEISRRFDVREFITAHTGAGISSHVGPGAYGAFFYSAQEA